MRKQTFFAAIAVLMVLTLTCGWLIGTGHAAEKATPMPTSVAVVDIVKLFNEYQRTKEINDRLTKQQQDLQTQRKQKLDRIDALKAELENFHPDSKDYYERQKELLKLSIELDSYSRVTAEEIKREFQVLTEDIYKEMTAAIEAVAKEAGYELVLFVDKMEIKGDTFPTLLENIRQRKVLYNAPRLDITDSVLDYINQDYKLKQSKK
jgi:Skp family chaperone for outer membrane proteins